MTPRSLLHPARLARRPVLSTQSDSRLVDLFRAGYEPAFEAIVERYRRQLLRYAGRILPGERAEDVVQLAFVKAYEAMRRDSRELELRPWLYRIVHNTALNGLRERRPVHQAPVESLDGVERPDEALERSQGIRELLAAVQALPVRQRDAIVLRELEGRSYEEIGRALGVSNGAVRQLLNRARHTLRAAASAIAPAGWVARIPWEGPAEPAVARMAETLGMAGAGAVAAKLCATALVTGAVVGGVAALPGGGPSAPAAGEAQAADQARAGEANLADATGGFARTGDAGGDPGGPAADRSGRSGPGDAGVDRSGPGDGDLDADRSGPGDGDGDADRSGPGDGDGEADRSGGDGDGDLDRSGPGDGSGLDTSGSGGGGGGSGGGTSRSGEDSGSGGSYGADPVADTSGVSGDDAAAGVTLGPASSGSSGEGSTIAQSGSSGSGSSGSG